MNLLEDLKIKIKDCYDETNFSGAIDVIVVEQKDGSLMSSPFYVQFGKFGVQKLKNKIVTIEINGEIIKSLQMRLFDNGEAYFTRNSFDISNLDNNFQDTTLNKSDFDMNNELKKNESSIYNSEPELNDFIDYFKAAEALNNALNLDQNKKEEIKVEICIEPLNNENNNINNNDNKSLSCESNYINSSQSELSFSNNKIVGRSFYKCLLNETKNLGRKLETGSLKLKDCRIEYNSKDEISIGSLENLSNIVNNKRINKTKMTKENHPELVNLSSDELKKLKLRPGINEIKYYLGSTTQDAKRVASNIYLYNHNDKIVISDVDGTITKSDIMGQILPILGKDWYHLGIAELYTSIVNNKYKIVYLSARSMCQSELTRNLLKNINQSNCTLPEGPLILNPSKLIGAFQTEVIEKKSDEFKTSCLLSIKSLFDINENPFYAGFGNRPTDFTTYKTIGIDEKNIFIVNQNGEINFNYENYLIKSSYLKLKNSLDFIFPKLN